jgi:hypothetical protein
MNTDTQSPKDDGAFDRELRDLYRTALFDEDFQLQVATDLRSLPKDVQANLKQADQVFIHDAVISDDLSKKLMAINCGCPKPKPWWKKLFVFNFDMGNFLSPVFSLPVSVMAGILLGVFLVPKVMTQFNSPFTSLGGDISTTVQEPVLGDITEDTKREPQKWLTAIADLVRQGKITEAQAQLQEFDMRHPGYSVPE